MNKTYPNYIESGIEWLGEMPGHWSLSKLKHASQVNPRKGSSDFEKDSGKLVTFLPMEKVSEDGRIDTSIQKPISDLWSGYTYFERGDTIVAKITPCFENGKAAHLSDLGCPIGFGSTEFHVLRPRDEVSDGRFLYYLAFSHVFRETGEAFMTGAAGQKRIPTQFVEEFDLALPPLPEQRTIAAYLDLKTAQIDTLIAKKQRLIDLLQEQRTAVINRAVTQGLDPDAPMQDSGIEWLGEVPAHWSLPKLKWITTKIGSGSTPRGGSEVYQEDGVIFLRSQNIQFDGLDLEDVAYISENIHADMERSAVEPGDVLLNITGASIGRCTYVPRDFDPANVNQHVCIVRPMDAITSEYLQVVLASKVGQYQVFSLQDGSSREGLNFAQLGSFAIPLPDIEEQKAIARAAKTETDKIDEVVSREKKEINLLQELRTSLISEVVTGKIDVRDEVSERGEVAV